LISVFKNGLESIQSVTYSDITCSY